MAILAPHRLQRLLNLQGVQVSEGAANALAEHVEAVVAEAVARTRAVGKVRVQTATMEVAIQNE